MSAAPIIPLSERHPDELVDSATAGQLLGGLSPKTLANQRVRGDGARFLKVGGLVRYQVRDLTAYLESCRRSSTSDAASVSSVRSGRGLSASRPSP